MKINLNSPNFTSRKPAIRQADRICRMVNVEFPAISSSKISRKIESDKKYKKYYSYAFNLSHKIGPKIRDKVAPFKKDIIERLKKMAELVKLEKLANCDEYTKLASIICAANGIKTQSLIVKYISNETLDEKPCGHVALAIVPNGEIQTSARMSKMKDVIIIDPWLGLADYAPNVALKYKNIFPEYLKLKQGDEPIMTPANFNFELKEKHFEDIKKEFPKFILKS